MHTEVFIIGINAINSFQDTSQCLSSSSYFADIITIKINVMYNKNPIILLKYMN